MKYLKFSIIPALFIIISGCATHSNRVSTSVEDSQNSPATPSPEQILITTSGVNSAFIDLGRVTVTLKKLTLFHPNPTEEQANLELEKKARELGADAVINVTYKSGVGFTTWNYLEAIGTAIKFEQ